MSKLYERLPNGRYREARETVAMDSLPEGAHLIIVRPGSRATIHKVEPDHAALVAAAHDALPAGLHNPKSTRAAAFLDTQTCIHAILSPHV